MINKQMKYNEKDAVLDSFYRLFVGGKDKTTLLDEVNSLKGIAGEKEKTRGKVPELDRVFPQYIMIGTTDYPEKTFEETSAYEEIKQAFLNDENKISLPVLLDTGRSVNLFVEYNEERLAACQAFTHNVMWSFLSEIPVSKLNICVFDCERRGGSITPFLEFKKKAGDVFDKEIHTDAEDILNRLKAYNAQIDERIQSKLGSKYKSITEYNISNPARAEVVHLLILNDFPSGLDKNGMNLLLNILKNGSKSGIYTLINYNRDISLAEKEMTEEYLEQVKRLSSVMDIKNNCSYHTVTELPLDGYINPTDVEAGQFVEEYLERAEEWKHRPVAFEDITDLTMFGKKLGNGLEIPIGTDGEEEIFSLTLGKGNAQHGIVVGPAVSGKSTLLHTLIMSAMLHYAPDQLQLYLLDFKQGEEFKVYESYRLPHVKLLAMNAMQEFGEGVLENLVKEMETRNSLLKEAGVTKLGEYATVTGKTMPAILVVMDEISVLLDTSANKKVANHCAALIHKIVTEGNGVGIRLMVATRSLNAILNPDLSTKILETIKVRIGMRCGEADAQYLFGSNAAGVLELMEDQVGTAVVSRDDAQQEILGFRVAYCDGNKQKELLQKLETECEGYQQDMQIFAGSRAVKLLDRYALKDKNIDNAAKIAVEFGELVKNASPLEIVFDKKNRHNVLICGSNENMSDTLFHTLLLGVLKHQKARVYCMDGDILVGEAKSGTIYQQYERFEERFKLAASHGDIFGFVHEIYDLYIQKQKANDDSVVFAVIKDLQLQNPIKRLMLGEEIDEQEYGNDSKNRTEIYADGTPGDDEKGQTDSGGLSVTEKWNRLMEEGASYGFYFVMTCNEVRSIKECGMDVGQIEDKFPERFLFASNDRNAENTVEGVNLAALGEELVYYTDSMNHSGSLKPFIFPAIQELETYLNALLGDENTAKWYKKATESVSGTEAKERGMGSENTDGMKVYQLALMYEEGRGVEQNDAEAVKCYEKAAAAGIPDAMYRLARMYEEGRGIDKNDTEAVHWYEKAAAAGITEAMYQTGRSYEEGCGVEINCSRAVKWYEDAAIAGHVKAMYLAGRLYEEGRGIEINYDEAAKWFEQAANNGNVPAMNRLALLYEDGRGVEQNYAEAKKWYEEVVNTNEADAKAVAMRKLGMLYAGGLGVEQNYAEALQWFEKAVDAGDVTSMNCLGEMYENGRGKEQDFVEAKKWYEKAVEAGDASAMNHLGQLYEYGQGVNQDYDKAAQWYEQAGKMGNAEAMNHMGLLYEKGQGVVQNYAEAARWYEKAAETGNSNAMYNMGWLYENGQGVELDYTEAARWYDKAAGAGNATAMNNLGVLYDIGRGVTQNYAEAAKWYEKAANAGDATAMKNLGALYKQGQGVAQNYGEAAKWYEKAANAGIATAMNNLGVLYDKGQGVPQNYTEAAKWYQKAADAGVASAMNNLGLLYDKGQGVAQNYTEAAKLYQKAAGAGVADAMNNLGVLYEHGNGVTQNYAEAAQWYEKAANAGIPDAMINLGALYKQGLGVEQNADEAAMWYEKASNAGNVFAMNKLGELQTKETKTSQAGKLVISIVIVLVVIIGIVLMQLK